MRIYKQYCQNKYTSDINSIDPECKDALHGTRKTILLEWKPTWCKHIRSAVIGLAHALCRDTWQARRCVVIVLVLRNTGCTTVYNKSKFEI